MLVTAKRILAALTVSVALASPGAADAAVFDLGPLVGPAVVPISNVIPTDGSPTPFVDAWLFDLPADSLFASLQFSVFFPILEVPGGFYLTDPAAFDTGLFASGGTPIAASVEFFEDLNVLSLIPAQPLAAGLDYFLTVSGVAIGTLGGLYTGELRLVPIDAPATFALLLAALALLGVALRRHGHGVALGS